jgi:hypothetical protein
MCAMASAKASQAGVLLSGPRSTITVHHGRADQPNGMRPAAVRQS